MSKDDKSKLAEEKKSAQLEQNNFSLELGQELHQIQSIFSNAIDFTKNQDNPSLWPAWKIAAFVALSSSEEKWEIYPLLNRTQRDFFFHLYVWNGDNVNLELFEEFLGNLTSLDDSSFIQEFIRSENFQLYLKTKYSIETFDQEEPNYPDHDEYFLSPDYSFIFVYDSGKEAPNLARDKSLLQSFYNELGVEYGYQALLQMIGDSYSLFLENRYDEKVKSDRDLGWVDYYEAIEVMALYRSETQLKKKAREIALDFKSLIGPGQTVRENLSETDESIALKYFYKTLVYYWVSKGILKQNQSLSTEQNRDIFLDSLTVVGLCIKIAIQFIEINQNIKIPTLAKMNLFEFFKIGNSLIFLWKKNVQDNLKSFFELGVKIDFLGIKFKEEYEHFYSLPEYKINDETSLWSNFHFLEKHQLWQSEFIQLATALGSQYQVLVQDLRVRSELYENYDVSEITIEEILLNSLVKFALVSWRQNDSKIDQNENNKKMMSFGIWKEDFLMFIHKFPLANPSGELAIELITNYLNDWKLPKTENWIKYFTELLNYHLVGINYSQLEDAEWQHVGGVVLFKIKEGVENLPH